MKQIWIIGGGRFGLRADRYFLGQTESNLEVTLVDRDRQSLEKAKSLGCATVAGDGVNFLFKEMKDLVMRLDRSFPGLSPADLSTGLSSCLQSISKEQRC